MSNNSSKQIMLSIIGVLLLVVAVVGVSFAFFTYTRNDYNSDTTALQTLTANFVKGDNITLFDELPISVQEGQNLSGINRVCTFSVTGYKENGGPISYSIYALKGDEIENKTRFLDKEVFLNIRRIDNDLNSSFEGNVKYSGNNATSINNIPSNGLFLGNGIINENVVATQIFEIRMWVDNSSVSVGDSGVETYTFKEYASKYYSLKIKVEE